jgi:hypothetical protein
MGGLDQRPPQLRGALLGQAAAALAVGRFRDGGVKAGDAHDLAGATKAAAVADLGEDVRGQHRTDAEEPIERDQALVLARPGA